VSDDKPGGDDLFEDLDKFFAPIRDVDWGSEDAAPTPDSPQEEHVAVRPSDADPIVIAEEPETAAAPVTSAVDDEDEEDAWYDTNVLEPIDELMGEAIEDEIERQIDLLEGGRVEFALLVGEPGVADGP